MPIYEFYCPDNHRIYQFFAKTREQAEQTPVCPDNPSFRMVKMLSGFAVLGAAKKSRTEAAGGEGERGAGAGGEPAEGGPGAGEGVEGGGGMDAEDARVEAAMGELEGVMDTLDENDPRQMARVMRRMSEITGERFDEQMEEVVRKLEEGTAPDKLEDQMGDAMPGDGGEEDGYGGGGYGGRRGGPSRDPNLYDY